eukprot:364584-Chlamydomonas_euryale.AAC.15
MTRPSVALTVGLLVGGLIPSPPLLLPPHTLESRACHQQRRQHDTRLPHLDAWSGCLVPHTLWQQLLRHPAHGRRVAGHTESAGLVDGRMASLSQQAWSAGRWLS